jgi:hypothetical protein
MAVVLRRFELDPTDDVPASGGYESLKIVSTPISEAVSVQASGCMRRHSVIRDG